VIAIYGATNKYADKVPVEKMGLWERDLLRFMDTQYPQVGQNIEDTLRLTEENEAVLKEALNAFTQGWEG
jgi:F-type H+-transporting ATPase subunit alpha